MAKKIRHKKNFAFYVAVPDKKANREKDKWMKGNVSESLSHWHIGNG